MTTATYLFGIATPLLMIAVIFDRLRRRRLRERHAVWWLLAALVALVVGVFPSALTWTAEAIGVEVPTNLIFFLGIAVLFLVSLQHASELTRAEAQIRTLAERVALLELEVKSAPPTGASTRAMAAPASGRKRPPA